MATLLQTSNIVWQTVHLTEQVNINLEYDVQHGLLNIFVRGLGETNGRPCSINVLSNDACERPSSLRLDAEPKMRVELSTIYVYDILDENPSPIVSLSTSSSFCYDEPTNDNDDGYSTHSLDDIEQHSCVSIRSSQSLVPFVSCATEQYISPVRRLMEALLWSSPFKKTAQQMMAMNHAFL